MADPPPPFSKNLDRTVSVPILEEFDGEEREERHAGEEQHQHMEDVRERAADVTERLPDLQQAGIWESGNFANTYYDFYVYGELNFYFFSSF